MASNKHGNTNEDILLSSLNNKQFKELNQNLKSFIYCLDSTIKETDIITVSKLAGNYKSDLKITIKNNTYNISVKMGSGNSVHQEKIEDFISFLSKTYDISEDLANKLRFFIWGDGTLDGSGSINSRLNATNLKENYPTLVSDIKNMLSIHKNDLINRFVFTGRCNDSIDYIYHGNDINGLWASKEEIFPHMLISNDNNKSLSVGILTFQAWNRSLNGNNDSKRGEIQLKCGSLAKALQKVMANRRGPLND